MDSLELDPACAGVKAIVTESFKTKPKPRSTRELIRRLEKEIEHIDEQEKNW